MANEWFVEKLWRDWVDARMAIRKEGRVPMTSLDISRFRRDLVIHGVRFFGGDRSTYLVTYEGKRYVETIGRGRIAFAVPLLVRDDKKTTFTTGECLDPNEVWRQSETSVPDALFEVRVL